MLQFDKVGIFLSKPISALLVVIYLLQSGLLVYLISNNFDLERQISFQQKRINELEEKLQIFKAIDDFQIGFNDEEVRELTDVIYTQSKKYHYDPMFTLAVILTESSFRRGQRSSVGARGLMQLMPTTIKELNVYDPFHPRDNINGGVKFLKQLLKRFKNNIPLSLAAYNAGANAVEKHEGIPPYQETQHYVKKVLNYFDLYRREL